MAEWSSFYVMFGGAAAALTGLILVAVSLHVKTVLGHPLHRDRAFASLQGLLSAMLLALAALTPQPLFAFGVETLLIGLFWVVRYARFIGLYRNIHTRHRTALHGREWIWWGVWLIGLLVSGVGMLLDDARALFVLAGAAAWGVVIIVWNAWVLLADVSAD